MSFRDNLQELAVNSGLPLYSQDGIPEEDKQIIAVVESASLGWTWIIYECAFDKASDHITFFGRVNGFASELGYFTLDELATDSAACFIVNKEEQPLG
tara:strand:+ start:572 stop:865 length:294 start_codon:yes stop_codon:yes gene_type:complete